MFQRCGFMMWSGVAVIGSVLVNRPKSRAVVSGSKVIETCLLIPFFGGEPCTSLTSSSANQTAL